ncbi:MAG: GAF domain-containing protein [Chloroflexi bacterium]|nr:GAF domain-containing protein [Chloroflexota bacterium]
MKLNNTLRYAILGACFGALFPLAAAMIWAYEQKMPLTWQIFYLAQIANPLQWIINTAPLFLGWFAALAGLRQDRVEKLLTLLQTRLEEQVLLVNEREKAKLSLEGLVLRQEAQLIASDQLTRQSLSALELDEILNSSVRMISSAFGFYHTAIFLLDPGGEFAILRAASSEGGQRMLTRKHRLKVGHQGIVGHVADSGNPRIALDVGADAVFFDNPDLPATRSELAIPLKPRGKVIGVLDVQSTETQAFSQADINTLQTLANQIALAYENLRNLRENQAVIAELNALVAVDQKASWERFLQRKVQAVSLDEWGNKQVNPASADERRDSDSHLLTAPVMLRGQRIGEIELQRDKKLPPWSPEEINIVAATLNQVALALDNARLLEEARQRAQNEQLIGEIAARAQSSLDLETVMKTAVTEISKALGAVKVQIRVAPPQPSIEPVSPLEDPAGAPRS